MFVILNADTCTLYNDSFRKVLSLSLLLFSATEEIVTKSAEKTIEKEIKKITNTLVEETGIPSWGLVAILIGNKACAFRKGDF